MPVPYSNNLHWRIVRLNAFLEVEAAEVAKYMHVSERTVYRYVERYKVTGDVRQCVKSNGPRQLLCEYEELLLVQFILEYI